MAIDAHLRRLSSSMLGLLPVLLSFAAGAACASTGSGDQGDDAGSPNSVPPQDAGSDSTSPRYDSGSSSGADTSFTEEDGPSANEAAGMEGGDVWAEASTDALGDTSAESGGQDVVTSDASTDAPCGCPARSVCVSGLCTGAQRVFVSSGVYSGNLGGSPGADATCGMLAAGAGLGGTWMAWLADGTNPPPSQRFYKSLGPYRLINGAVVALNFPALTNTDLFNAIDVDQTGASQASASVVKVWTGTTATGDASTNTCMGFTVGDASAAQGEVGQLVNTSSGNWADDATEPCNKQFHIYCFEQ
jgi:hypothetical protein